MNEPKRPIHRKHIPQRMCAICRTKDAKRQMTRVVRTAEGVFVDVSGKMNGRGAYICSNVQCWERAVKTEILAKALKVALSGEDRQRLQQATPLS